MTTSDLRLTHDAHAVSSTHPPDGAVTAPLRTRRAALVFVAIVFLATLVQVLANPLAGLFAESVTWQHPLPLGVVVLIVAIGCFAQAACLLWSARHPLLAVVATLGLYLGLVVVSQAPNWLGAMQLVIAIALFLLATARPAPTALIVLTLSVVILVGVLTVWALSLGVAPGNVLTFLLSQTVGFVAAASAATALGLWWSRQARRAQRARERADAATREYEVGMARAREIERDRIARELHDVAAQHLAGLLTLADGALTVAASRPTEALQLLQEVRAEGHFAAASLYGALADLSAVEGETTGQTQTLRSVAELLEFWRARGVDVTLSQSGRIDDVPAVVSATGFRCVQEALTNAAKHALGAPVHVDIDAAPTHLHVTVENDPAPEPSGASRPGLGWGLEGLRERVRLLDGTLTAGPTDTGGFVVRLTVPLTDFSPAGEVASAIGGP
ncbi:sensor histidine kinase [Microbacterium sp. P05]|uniref:sensor histidine kinase n=1 Tax=Microbacterium sp. P05 TaxID=3366948 RepID=UPI003746681C